MDLFGVSGSRGRGGGHILRVGLGRWREGWSLQLEAKDRIGVRGKCSVWFSEAVALGDACETFGCA